ncbi:uncharacterized protein RHTO_01169 [Rhodotorula toruloides NP11]|uniref:Uncharacterized protein n=1 Tax=Rhodotorula toruloides (strain NP11) TaxID=1130832 RepID=M7XDQ9_RHOT1|nr:uncharacterized protein RHTO_01169 [Rhodotorula toruloides NP11]EMS21954.1 hypothetical protein RHTO_01169 [Rhodotorula toruloides NP11]
MLLSYLATALLVFSSLATASNSSAALPDLDPADLPDPRTLIYKEVCFRNVFDEADDLPLTAQTATKDSNNHRIFYRTGTKEDFDPVDDTAEEEKEDEEEGEGVMVGFEEFCYRMRKAKGDVEEQKGQAQKGK